MRWADIDLTAGVWSKPPSSTKQKQHHEAQLSAPARQLLSEIREQQAAKHRSGRSASSSSPAPARAGTWSTSRSAGDSSAAPRRSMACAFMICGTRSRRQAISGGASLPLVGALLGHASPTTTARYAHMFTDPQKAAVERIGAVITAAGKPATEPTPIKRRR